MYHLPFPPSSVQSWLNPAGTSAFVLGGDGVWENVWDQKVLNWLELDSWRAGLAGGPGKPRPGLRQVLWQKPDLWKSKTGAREWEQPRRKTASEKIASQMENTLREQEATNETGSHPNGKEVKPREKWDIQPQAKAVFASPPPPFEVSVEILRWICYLNWAKALFLFRVTGQWHK